MLSIRHLSKFFGGVKAVDDISIDVEKGAIHAVIGPNGAGKTTLFNLVTGVYTPTSGEIVFREENVAGKVPEELASRGMSRTFQNLQICMNMSAIDNVMVGAHLRLNQSMLAGIFRWPALKRADETAREEAAELMQFAGIGAYISHGANQMSYGALKRLEIARALISRPDILLLDEPAAGLNHTETAEIEALIHKVAQAGITVLLVEHDMKLVMNLSHRITVLDFGKKLAEGTPAQIRDNPAVISAYLGATA